MKKIVSIIQIIILFNMFFFFVSCSKNEIFDNIDKINDENILNNEISNLNKEEENNVIFEEDNYEDELEELSGTCYRGRHCFSPSCPLWSDLDNNSECDRGV